MAMTISEATAVNLVLDQFLAPGRTEVDPQVLRSAVGLLARSAYRPLMAGWDENRALEAFDARAPRRGSPSKRK